MRLHHPGGRLVHLGLGVDVPPGSGVAGILARLDVPAAAVRARLGVETLGLSLWLEPALTAALAVDSRARHRLRAELDARGLEVVTLSGRPHRSTGGPDGHHEPDWSTHHRLEYTLDLARVLVDLLPDDAVRGSVSTLGLGRRDGWDTERQRACARVLGRLSAGLAEMAWQTGRAVRVGFEPEPGYVMDTAANTVAALAGLDADRLGVCLDLATLAGTGQEPVAAIDQLGTGGVSVVRVRVAAPDSLTASTSTWRPVLRRLMAGAVPVCDQLDLHAGTGDLPVPAEGGRDVAALAEGDAAALAYLRDELVTLGLVPPHRACAAR